MNNDQIILLMAFVVACSKKAAGDEIANLDREHRRKLLMDQVEAQMRLQSALGLTLQTTGNAE